MINYHQSCKSHPGTDILVTTARVWSDAVEEQHVSRLLNIIQGVHYLEVDDQLGGFAHEAGTEATCL